MTESNTWPELKPGDKVHHKTRDSHSWAGKILAISPRHTTSEEVALVELDDHVWSKWRLVPLRTLEAMPKKCQSFYSIQTDSGDGRTWAKVFLCTCDLSEDHRQLVRLHHAKVGPVGDQADIYW
jgi:hypothetical protein